MLNDITQKFIRVPPQLVVQFGAKNKRAWFLDLEEHPGDLGVLLMTLPGCPLCVHVARLLAQLQHQSDKRIFVYVLEIGPSVPKSQTLLRNMDVVRVPSIFVCKTTTGRLIRVLDGERDEEQLKHMTIDALSELLFSHA